MTSYAQNRRNIRKAKRLIAANKFPAAAMIFVQAKGYSLQEACEFCAHLRWEMENA